MNELDMLPDEFRSRSYSDEDIVLSLDDALLAIDYLETAKWALLGWEGWISDGNRLGHHQGYQGTVSLSPKPGETWDGFVRRSADFCRSTVKLDQRRFDEDPSVENMILLFCLTAVTEQEYPSTPLF